MEGAQSPAFKRPRVQLQRTIYEKVRIAAGRATCPSVVIMDGQSVKTSECGGPCSFDAHKRVKGRKRHIPGRYACLSPAGWNQPIRRIVAEALVVSRFG